MTKKITILALSSFLPLVANAALEQVWLPGVSESGGWSDFNKNPYKAGDEALCWALAAANIIDWWQGQYQIRAEIPQGEEIWNTFKSSFSDDGGDPGKAFTWWLDGTYDSYYGIAELTNYNTGGYYFNSWDSPGASRYVTSIPGGSYESTSRMIVDYMKQGIGLTLSSGGIAPHQLTLWGVEYDTGDGLIKRMWITDSDDGENKLLEVTAVGVKITESSVEESLGFRAEDYWVEGNTKDIYINGAHGLKPGDAFLTRLPSVPEPSAFGLLLGLTALAFAGTRRSRRKFEK